MRLNRQPAEGEGGDGEAAEPEPGCQPADIEKLPVYDGGQPYAAGKDEGAANDHFGFAPRFLTAGHEVVDTVGEEGGGVDLRQQGGDGPRPMADHEGGGEEEKEGEEKNGRSLPQ